MGATPLIDENQEVELARELQDAREKLAKIALRLPAVCKEYTLEGDSTGPKRGREWPLDDMEEFYGRLLRYYRENKKEAKLATLVQQAAECRSATSITPATR